MVHGYILVARDDITFISALIKAIDFRKCLRDLQFDTFKNDGLPVYQYKMLHCL